MKNLTAGELKKALENVPNDAIVRLTSDTGVDQGQCGGEIVVEDAYYTYCAVGIDFFDIYVNEEDVE